MGCFCLDTVRRSGSGEGSPFPRIFRLSCPRFLLGDAPDRAGARRTLFLAGRRAQKRYGGQLLLRPFSPAGRWKLAASLSYGCFGGYLMRWRFTCAYFKAEHSALRRGGRRCPGLWRGLRQLSTGSAFLPALIIAQISCFGYSLSCFILSGFYILRAPPQSGNGGRMARGPYWEK